MREAVAHDGLDFGFRPRGDERGGEFLRRRHGKRDRFASKGGAFGLKGREETAGVRGEALHGLADVPVGLDESLGAAGGETGCICVAFCALELFLAEAGFHLRARSRHDVAVVEPRIKGEFHCLLHVHCTYRLGVGSIGVSKSARLLRCSRRS
jgi:hypothetical protein